MKNFVQSGDTVSFTAAADTLSGAPVLIGSLFGVAVADVKNGDPGEMMLSGVFDLPKTTGQAWTIGQLLYWSGTAVTNVASTNKLIGAALSASASGDTTGRVRLNGGVVN